MRKLFTTTAALLLFSSGAQAGYLDFFDKDYWTLDNINSELYRLSFKYIEKKLKKENDDPNAHMWGVNHALLNDHYRRSQGYNADFHSCRNKKFNKNPSSILGANPPEIINGIPTYTVAKDMPYILHQRDLSKRGIERVRNHYFSWVIPSEYIIHNPGKEDNEVSYVFNNLGSLTVFNIAFASEWFFEAIWGGSFDDGSSNVNGIPKVGFGGGKFLERYSCGYYSVNVVKNTAPILPDRLSAELDMSAGCGGCGGAIINFGAFATDRENTFLSGNYVLTYKDGRKFFGTGTVIREFPLRLFSNLQSFTVVVSDGALSTTKTYDLTTLLPGR